MPLAARLAGSALRSGGLVAAKPLTALRRQDDKVAGHHPTASVECDQFGAQRLRRVVANPFLAVAKKCLRPIDQRLGCAEPTAARARRRALARLVPFAMADVARLNRYHG